MRFLLDTHIFLWAIDDSPRLNDTYKQLLNSTDHQPVLSIVSLWEMSIKIGIGKLKPFGNFPDVVKQHVTSKGLELLQIKPEHLDSLVNLPQHHRDPFDRLLIAQAIYEDIPILTDDSLFSNYPIKKLEL